MPRKAPSIRSLLMTTTPDAPYAPPPSYGELLAALGHAAQEPANAQYEAAQLVARDATYRAWLARRDALRSAVLGHDLKATPAGQSRLVPCHCATCGRWRQELQRLYVAARQQQ